MNVKPNRRGASALEFGFTAIPLLFVVLGSMEYGWFFCNTLVMDEVVQVVSDAASTQLIGDTTDARTVGRTWEADGIALWDAYGLPGVPSFETEVLSSGGVLLVHVTGTLNYTGLVNGFYGLTGLPATVEMTVARRLDDQELGNDVLALF